MTREISSRIPFTCLEESELRGAHFHSCANFTMSLVNVASSSCPSFHEIPLHIVSKISKIMQDLSTLVYNIRNWHNFLLRKSVDFYNHKFGGSHFIEKVGMVYRVNCECKCILLSFYFFSCSGYSVSNPYSGPSLITPGTLNKYWIHYIYFEHEVQGAYANVHTNCNDVVHYLNYSSQTGPYHQSLTIIHQTLPSKSFII